MSDSQASSVLNQQREMRKEILAIIPKESLKWMHSRNPSYTFWTFLHIWFALFLCYASVITLHALYGFHGLIAALPLALFIATRQNAFAVQIHEASHFLLFKSRTHNDIFCNLFGAYWVLNDVQSYRTTHWKHHKHIHSDQDPDLSLYRIDAPCKNRPAPLKHVLKDLTCVTALKRIATYTKENKIGEATSRVQKRNTRHHFEKFLPRY